MNENDFLYSRQESMPEDFGKKLWEQLQEQDKQQPKTAFWTVAVASLLTVIIGVALVLSRVPSIVTLVSPPAMPPTFTQHGIITANNLDQLQPFARLGNGSITGMHMLPDGEHLLITATTGLYLHDAHDLSAEPQQIYTGTIGDYSDMDDNGYLYGVDASLNPPQAQGITVSRWNTVTGERIDFLHLDNLTIHAIEDLNVKPDGSQILLRLCLEFQREEYAGTVCKQRALTRYDVITGEQIDTIPLPDFNLWQSHAISDDWSYIAYDVDADEREEFVQPVIRLMNMTTHETRTVISFSAPLSVEWRNTVAVGGIAFSPDGQYLMTSSFAGPQILYAIYDLSSLWETEAPVNPGMNVDAILHQISSSIYIGNALHFSPDNQHIFAIRSHQLLQYDLASDERWLQPTLTSDPNQGYSMPLADAPVFSPDSSSIYIWYQGNVVMAYDTETLTKIDEMAYYQNDYAEAFQFTNDGTQVAIHTGYYTSGIPDIWTINTDPPIHETFLPDETLTPVNEFAISPDGTTIAYQTDFAWSNQDAVVTVQRRRDNAQPIQLSVQPPLIDIGFLQDGTFIGLGTEESTGYLTLLRGSIDNNGNINMSLSGDEIPFININSMIFHFTGAKRFAIDPRGQWFALSPCRMTKIECERDEFSIWNMQTGEQITIENNPNFHEYGAMAFSPDSRLFAYGYCTDEFVIVDSSLNCDAGQVSFYTMESLLTHQNGVDVPPPEPQFTLTGFTELPINIAFNPIQQADGSWLVAITEWNSRTQLWRVHEDGTAEVLRILDTVHKPVAFDPTGSLMFTTADTLQTEVWGVPLVEIPSR